MARAPPGIDGVGVARALPPREGGRPAGRVRAMHGGIYLRDSASQRAVPARGGYLPACSGPLVACSAALSGGGSAPYRLLWGYVLRTAPITGGLAARPGGVVPVVGLAADQAVRAAYRVTLNTWVSNSVPLGMSSASSMASATSTLVVLRFSMRWLRRCPI